MSGNAVSSNPLSYAGILPNNPPNQIRNDRPPNSTDINANIGDEWEDYSVTPSNFWKLANLFYNRATWILMSSETIATEYVANTGAAVPALGILNVLGLSGITTSASGNSIFIGTSPIVATEYVANTGAAVPALGILNVLGQNGITTSASGDSIFISGSGTLVGSVTTNGDVTQTVLTIPTTALSANTIEAKISGYATPIGAGVTAGIGGMLSGVFLTGSVSTGSIGVPIAIVNSFLSTSATFTASGSGLNVLIKVTGDAAYNINWTCTATNQIAS